jgi:hypothetical protein
VGRSERHGLPVQLRRNDSARHCRPYAIAGHEDGFGKGIFLVGDDFGVSTLNGYATAKISSPDVDRAIEGTTDKTTIRVSVFIAGGHSYVAVQTATWCWVYDVGMQTWHERQSYLKIYWRAAYPIKAFEKWLCTDLDTGNIWQIDAATQDEVGQPIRMRIETGPFGAFPSPLRINTIEMYLTKGVGIATGTDPVQTEPDIEVSVSRDGGRTGQTRASSRSGLRRFRWGALRAHLWGHVDAQGVRWRFRLLEQRPAWVHGRRYAGGQAAMKDQRYRARTFPSSFRTGSMDPLWYAFLTQKRNVCSMLTTWTTRHRSRTCRSLSTTARPKN